MTKQVTSPEIALKQIQQRIINVINSVENFADTLSHCEEERQLSGRHLGFRSRFPL